jgi:hypothetical protein
VANLVLIAVMVAIFGAALLLPFPKGHGAPAFPPRTRCPNRTSCFPTASPHTWPPGGPDWWHTNPAKLGGTSLTATYGPPYNTNGTPQSEWFAPANVAGVRQPIDAAQTFVLGPLAAATPTDPALAAALTTYRSASASQQAKWAAAYGNAITKVKFINGNPVVPKAADGPVPALLAAGLTLARSGGIDTDLLAQRPFYGTDFTKPPARSPQVDPRAPAHLAGLERAGDRSSGPDRPKARACRPEVMPIKHRSASRLAGHGQVVDTPSRDPTP